MFVVLPSSGLGVWGCGSASGADCGAVGFESSVECAGGDPCALRQRCEGFAFLVPGGQHGNVDTCGDGSGLGVQFDTGIE